MSKSRYDIKIVSHGIYDGWNRESKALPQIVRVVDRVPCKIDIEFGMIVQIRHAKGHRIDWCIDHPGILDDRGRVRDPFEGSERIKSADWKFFLGDTIWNPPKDKLGPWLLSVHLEGVLVAEKTITVVEPDWTNSW